VSIILIVSEIGFITIVDANPTEMSTVYTIIILVHSSEIADKLRMESIVVVFDQTIYAKAQQIRWQNEVFCYES
jgi:hypothetical protein